MIATVKVLTKQRLARLNTIAANAGMRSIRPSVVTNLSTEHIYPISQTYLHNDREVRCTVVLDKDGRTGVLDVALVEFSCIPTVDYTPSQGEPCDDKTDSEQKPEPLPPPEAIASDISSPVISPSTAVPVRRRTAKKKTARATSKSSNARSRTRSKSAGRR